jgi:hypothetical protein
MGQLLSEWFPTLNERNVGEIGEEREREWEGKEEMGRGEGEGEGEGEGGPPR